MAAAQGFGERRAAVVGMRVGSRRAQSRRPKRRRYNVAMHERIKIDPQIQHGRPVIRGTRVPVETILANLAGRSSWQEIIEDYGVTEEDIAAALEYAGELVSDQQRRAVAAK
jgi:uncharacterized protein (DUF433 family)